MKRLSIIAVALCLSFCGSSALAQGIGSSIGHGLGTQHSSVSGGAFGSSAAAPGTNSLGTALGSSGHGRGYRIKGAPLGTGNAAVARENARVQRMVHSICRGC